MYHNIKIDTPDAGAMTARGFVCNVFVNLVIYAARFVLKVVDAISSTISGILLFVSINR